MTETKTYPCATCKLRAKCDNAPRSLAGRFWRWHIGFCPGWKAYYTHLPEAERNTLRERYGLKK